MSEAGGALEDYFAGEDADVRLFYILVVSISTEENDKQECHGKH